MVRLAITFYKIVLLLLGSLYLFISFCFGVCQQRFITADEHIICYIKRSFEYGTQKRNISAKMKPHQFLLHTCCLTMFHQISILLCVILCNDNVTALPMCFF